MMAAKEEQGEKKKSRCAMSVMLDHIDQVLTAYTLMIDGSEPVELCRNDFGRLRVRLTIKFHDSAYSPEEG